MLRERERERDRERERIAGDHDVYYKVQRGFHFKFHFLIQISSFVKNKPKTKKNLLRTQHLGKLLWFQVSSKS